MNKATLGIIIQIVHFGDTSVIAKVLTPEYGIISFIYKGVRKKNKNALAHLLFPGAMLNIDFNHYPHKDLQYASRSQIAHPYFIAQTTVVKNCILTFIVEVIKNLATEGDDCDSIFDTYKQVLDILQGTVENECANLPIYTLINLASITGYKIINNYSEFDKTALDIDLGQFVTNNSTITPPTWIKHLSYFLTHQNWNDVQHYSMNKEDRKQILEVYIHFLKRHHSNFQNFKSLDILSVIIS